MIYLMRKPSFSQNYFWNLYMNKSDESIRYIKQAKTIDTEISIPPSKSYTNRALIAAALGDGTSKIIFPSHSNDTKLLVEALTQFGIEISRNDDSLVVVGSNGQFNSPSDDIFVGNAGTAMRFLVSFSAIAKGNTTLIGDEQMNHRPIGDLIAALRSAGVKCNCNNGYPPVSIQGGNFIGGRIEVQSDISSQFISSILLAAPYARRRISLHIKGGLSSTPYVAMTLHVMRSFGAKIDSLAMQSFQIDNKQQYIGQDFFIEPDASSATYFLGAAAITKGRVIIQNLPSESLQGDLNFLSVLSDLGCTIIKHPESIEIHGGQLHGIEIDMNEMLDCVPTLAVVAAFAKGATTIKNIEQLKYKETDRLNALATELAKIGAKVEVNKNELIIYPQPLHGATIDTYNDHRIAMSFAIAGLIIKGIGIQNPECVKKSFPTFWDEFKKLEPIWQETHSVLFSKLRHSVKVMAKPLEF
jgi:3-phosphoshikimate 1-carboxyvinyltransferase